MTCQCGATADTTHPATGHPLCRACFADVQRDEAETDTPPADWCDLATRIARLTWEV